MPCGPIASAATLRCEPARRRSAISSRSRKDGQITVAVPQVETGQGIWTALPQIVADELGAAWETIGVEPAPLTGRYGNPLASEEGWLDGVGYLRAHAIEADGRMRVTAGSTSIRAYEQPVREAAAVARTMLVGAAADRWNVSPDQCETGDGFVINGGRTFTFGELAEEAAARSPPAPRSCGNRPGRAWPGRRWSGSTVRPRATAVCVSPATSGSRGCCSPRSGCPRPAGV